MESQLLDFLWLHFGKSLNPPTSQALNELTPFTLQMIHTPIQVRGGIWSPYHETRTCRGNSAVVRPIGVDTCRGYKEFFILDLHESEKVPGKGWFCHLDNLGVVSGGKFEHASHREICCKLVARNADAGRSDLIGRYVKPVILLINVRSVLRISTSRRQKRTST